MGFLDKAKAAATDLQQKADAAMSNSGLMGGNPMGGPAGGMPGGDGDRVLRDLGVLTYLNAVGRPGSTQDYHRLMERLRALEASGGLDLSLTPLTPAGYGGPGSPPPPPGAMAAAAAAGNAPANSPIPPPPPPVPDAAPPPPPSYDPAPPTPDVVADVVEEEARDVRGGEGQGPPPPPPSWA